MHSANPPLGTMTLLSVGSHYPGLPPFDPIVTKRPEPARNDVNL